MKKIKIIYLILIVFFISPACDKDFLETQSKSTFTEKVAFSNLDFATKTVMGIYQYLTESNLFDYYWYFTKVDSDIEFTFRDNDNGGVSMAHYAATEGSTRLKYMWNDYYFMIERANLCIDNLPESDLWDDETYGDDMKQLYGEAVTLRAYAYSELISLWGDVPFKTKSTQNGDNFYLPKTDRDEIYEYLIQDLKDVEDYVPWLSAVGTTERVNKAFVKGLRARMALAYAGFSLRNKTLETKRGRNWQEYYKIANQECKEVMESGKHRLNQNFEDIFKTLHSYNQDMSNGEVLFEVALGRLVSGRVSETIGMPHSSSDKKYGRASASFGVSLPYFWSFDKEDVRRNTSVELYYYTSADPYQKLVYRFPSMCKWRKEWINPSMGGDLKGVAKTGINWPLMRYSDILLMYAETENEINGPTGAAKSALSRVRERAFDVSTWGSKVVTYVDSVASSKEDFFNAIVDERAWEFGGELLRKGDLIRWNMLGEKLDEMKENTLKILTNDPEFSMVPDYIYYKMEDDGETINILNPDYRIGNTSIEGYKKYTYYPINSSRLEDIQKYLNTIIANGYDKAKNNHLMPLSVETIDGSNGMLTNDQIP